LIGEDKPESNRPALSNEERTHEARDRLPSEIFAAIGALKKTGSKDLQLVKRKVAIEGLLGLIAGSHDEYPTGTLYDKFAINAWREGRLPPAPKRGRPAKSWIEAVLELLRKSLFQGRYKELRRLEPSLSAEERVERGSEDFGVDIESLNDIVRTSSKVLRAQRPNDSEFPDVLGMWHEWSALQKK